MMIWTFFPLRITPGCMVINIRECHDRNYPYNFVIVSSDMTLAFTVVITFDFSTEQNTNYYHHKTGNSPCTIFSSTSCLEWLKEVGKMIWRSQQQKVWHCSVFEWDVNNVCCQLWTVINILRTASQPFYAILKHHCTKSLEKLANL